MGLREAVTYTKEHPRDAAAWAALSQSLHAAGLHQEARESLERAIYLDPEDGALYDQLFAMEEVMETPPWLARLSEVASRGHDNTIPKRYQKWTETEERRARDGWRTAQLTIMFLLGFLLGVGAMLLYAGLL